MEVETLIKRAGNNGIVVRKDKVICTVKCMEDAGYVVIITAFALRKSNNKKELYFLFIIYVVPEWSSSKCPQNESRTEDCTFDS